MTSLRRTRMRLSRPVHRPAHGPVHRRRHPRNRRRAVLVGVLLAGSLTLIAGPAQAHDELISTSPADKGQIATLPEQVVLSFAEPPAKTGSQVLVTGPDGNAAAGQPVLSGDDVTQAIAPGSPAGTYTVTWRITADDGHAVFGKFSFTAAAGNALAPTSAAAGAAPTASAATGDPAAKPSSNKAVWLLVLLVLLIPLGLFVRRGAARAREAGEH